MGLGSLQELLLAQMEGHLLEFLQEQKINLKCELNFILLTWSTLIYLSLVVMKTHGLFNLLLGLFSQVNQHYLAMCTKFIA